MILVSPNAPDELNAALVRVLRDPVYRDELAARSWATHQAHIAWPASASRFATLLRP